MYKHLTKLLIALLLALPFSGWSQGFTISGTNLIDANGNNFIIKGFSVPTAWYVADVNNNIANMRNVTNANCLRIVVQTSSADSDWQTCVANCIANDIIPIVELHDVTCGTTASGLQNMANWWASKASYLTQPNISKYILINIANEWGDWNMAKNSPTTWRDAYISAVSTIRNAGINTTLIIDAPNCGQDVATSTLKNYAKTVFNSDTKKNCLFSLHMYCEWSTTGGSNVTTDLPNLKNMGIPVMVGEFGWQENNGSGGYCSINAASIINTCQSNGIGWLAWSWSGNNSTESFLDMSTDWAGTNLTTWGNTVVNGANGTKTASTCSVFIPSYGVDIALNKKIVVSSTETGTGNVASNAVDGNNSTRWSSAYADNQWAVIDLGATYSINDMVLNWESAYASAYAIQVSTDSINWTTIYTTTNGTGGIDVHTNLNTIGRYVRLALTTRATQWGFSLYEISVYGTLLTCSSTITPAGATSFCQGGNVVLNANTGTGLSYQWYNGSSAISGQTSASYTASATGSYTVKVTNASGCSATSTAQTVTVNALPTAAITATGATSFCQGGSVVLNANTGTGLSYQWYNGTSAISGQTSASYTASASGSYSVKVTNTSACSATSTAQTVTVNALPTATITATGTTSFCQGGSVVLNANTGTGLAYQWYNGTSAISGQTSASYTASTAGSYSVKVTNASSCSATSTAQTVTVNALPTAVVTPNGDTTFCPGTNVTLNANAGTGFTYQWYNGTSAISGQTTGSYTAANSGSYSVMITDANTCSSTSKAILVTASCTTTGVVSLNKNAEIQVWPNPFRTELNLSVPSESEIEVVDLRGRLVYQGKEVSILNLGELSSGIYILRITTSEGTSIVKVEKE